MPHDLSYRQEKIQEKRKLTSFRDYLKEIASRYPSMFYRREGIVSRYPDTLRCTKILNAIEFFDYAPTQTLEKTEGNFFEEMQILRNILPMPNLVNR
jgi:hypothetical protein